MIFRLPDGATRVWESRFHRKHRTDSGAAGLRKTLWAPASIGWWLAILFTIGSAMFAIGSLAGLSGIAAGTNEIFFAGSICFTAASYLQLLESINADRKIDPGLRFRWFAWWPARIGWLTSFIQLLGALLFNIDTFDALHPIPGWLHQDNSIWIPNLFGSIFFVVASQLSVQELCHGRWCWRPRNLSWWIVIINWIGSVAFLVSAFLAFVRPGEGGLVDAWWSTCLTFAGSICFLIGALLLLPESVSETSPSPSAPCAA